MSATYYSQAAESILSCFLILLLFSMNRGVGNDDVQAAHGPTIVPVLQQMQLICFTTTMAKKTLKASGLGALVRQSITELLPEPRVAPRQVGVGLDVRMEAVW